MDLNNLMEFDHVIQVNPDGTVSDDVSGVYAPELSMSVDADGQILDGAEQEYIAEAKRQGWDLQAGWTGQHAYRGVVMHPSEFVGGGLADHIMETPGLWVVISVETDDDSEDAAGWAVAYRQTDFCQTCGVAVVDRKCNCWCLLADALQRFTGHDHDGAAAEASDMWDALDDDDRERVWGNVWAGDHAGVDVFTPCRCGGVDGRPHVRGTIGCHRTPAGETGPAVTFCEQRPYAGAGYHCLRNAGHYRPAGHPDGVSMHSDLTITWDDDGRMCNADGTVI